MKFIVAKKQNMTQIFDEVGSARPATIFKAEPNVVTQIKDLDKDGYKAVQIGYGTQKEKRINKAQKGHSKNLGNFEGFKEFRVEDGIDLKEGDKIDVAQFEVGEKVNVSGISKGKGFQGVVKRHGFAGGPRTHGQKHSERKPGSIGIGGIQRVLKGTRMAGRMGADRVTTKNLAIVGVDKENNLILVEGAVPGRRGTLIEIRG